jgi:hypothetical protein
VTLEVETGRSAKMSGTTPAALPPGWSVGSRRTTRGGPLERDPRLADGPGGYRVVAVRVGAKWSFSAWGPECDPGLTYWDWAKTAHRQERYAVGEHVPQRSELLGSYGTSVEAFAACAAHLAGEPPARSDQACMAPQEGDGVGEGRGGRVSPPASPPGAHEGSPRPSGVVLPRQGRLAL